MSESRSVDKNNIEGHYRLGAESAKIRDFRDIKKISLKVAKKKEEHGRHLPYLQTMSNVEGQELLLERAIREKNPWEKCTFQ